MGGCQISRFQLFMVGVSCESPSLLPHNLHCSRKDQRSSRATELGTQVGLLWTQTAQVDSASGFRTRRQPAPRLHKDGSNSSILRSSPSIGGARHGNRTLLGTICSGNKLLSQHGKGNSWRCQEVTVEKVASELHTKSWVGACQKKGRERVFQAEEQGLIRSDLFLEW